VRCGAVIGVEGKRGGGCGKGVGGGGWRRGVKHDRECERGVGRGRKRVRMMREVRYVQPVGYERRSEFAGHSSG
jgi:hypothetical protein